MGNIFNSIPLSSSAESNPRRMWIIVAQSDGGVHTLEIDDLELGSAVYAKYEDASGAESGSYFLTYGGKQLTDTDVLASLNIREGATLHAVPEATSSQTVPNPSLSLSLSRRSNNKLRNGKTQRERGILMPICTYSTLHPTRPGSNSWRRTLSTTPNSFIVVGITTLMTTVSRCKAQAPWRTRR